MKKELFNPFLIQKNIVYIPFLNYNRFRQPMDDQLNILY